MRFDSPENLLLALLAEAWEFTHQFGFAGAFQSAQGGDGEFFVEGLDLLGAEAL